MSMTSQSRYLFDFLVEDVLDDFAEALELGFELFAAFLLVFVFRKFQAFLRDGNQSLAVVFFKLRGENQERMR